MNIFMAIIAMKQCTISSTTELSFIFTALIWDSNVSDMKFGWLDLFASRMSSYLNKYQNLVFQVLFLPVLVELSQLPLIFLIL
ncbi:hypothetical protein NC651_007908 [Populus alba x Populus x berolinensis]|nr:hypothetical protein NC651_007908 [Populus alba x Populus x berolinensis]